MRKLFIMITLMAMLASDAFAINDWKQGTGTDAIEGTTAGADIDANLKNYAVDPLDKLLSGYIHGCTITRTDAATITVSIGEVCCSNGAGTINRMRKNTATTTVSMIAAGVGGIDSGSAEKASTVYDVYAVADANATTFTAICAESGNALADVTYYRYIGSFFNNAASDIDSFTFIGNGSACSVVFDDPMLNTEYRVLNGGGAVAFTNVDCSGVIPTSAVSVDVNMQIGAGAAGVWFRKDGSSASNGIISSLYQTSNMDYGLVQNIPVSSRVFEYKVGAGSVTMYVRGYTFHR